MNSIVNNLKPILLPAAATPIAIADSAFASEKSDEGFRATGGVVGFSDHSLAVSDSTDAIIT